MCYEYRSRFASKYSKSEQKFRDLLNLLQASFHFRVIVCLLVSLSVNCLIKDAALATGRTVYPGGDPQPSLPLPDGDGEPRESFNCTDPCVGAASATADLPPVGPQPPVCPYTPFGPTPCSKCGCENGPATTNDPVMLRDGSKIERAVDFRLPAPGFDWSISRNYRTISYVPKNSTAFGNRWFSDSRDMVLDIEGLILIIGSSSKVKFSNAGGSKYVSDSNFEMEMTKGTFTDPSGVSHPQYTVKDYSTGRVYNFHDINGSGPSGRLREETTIGRHAAGLAGVLYFYDGSERVQTAVLPAGLDYFVKYEYDTAHTNYISKIEVWTDATETILVAELTYTYFQTSVHSDWVGSSGDLIQVKVKHRASADSEWFERVTQYRYYQERDGGTYGFLKGVIEHDDLMQLLADSSPSTASSVEDILTLQDCSLVISCPSGSGPGSGASSSARTIRDYETRHVEYYLFDEGDQAWRYDTLWAPGTSAGSGEDLETKYGGLNWDEVVEGGQVRSERVGGGCAGCGDSEQGTMKKYHYLWVDKGGNSHLYYLNYGGKADINEVSLLVIEDTATLDGTPLYRTIYGLNDDYRKLREVKIENPIPEAGSSAIKCWCQAWTYFDVPEADGRRNRVAEYRTPSAYDVTTEDDLRKFLHPYDSQLSSGTRWGNDNEVLRTSGGQIFVYDYNADGFRTDTQIKNGRSQPAYYLSATEYDDADDDFSGRDYDVKSVATATYVYPTKTAVKADGIKTTFEYEFWDANDTVVKSIKTIYPTLVKEQNGPELSTDVESLVFYDQQGRVRWRKDRKGIVSYSSYCPANDLIAYHVVDVDTAPLSPEILNGEPGKWDAWPTGTPTDFESLGGDHLQLVTKNEYDLLGREYLRIDPTTDQNPDGAEHYTAHESSGTGVDTVERRISCQYWDSTAGEPRLPIQVMEYDYRGLISSTYTLSPSSPLLQKSPSGVPVALSGTPTGSDLLSFTRYGYDPQTQRQLYVDRYHKIPATLPGTLSTNFDRQITLHDDEGNPIANIQTVEGTDESSARVQIRYTELDFLDRPVVTKRWVHAGWDVDPNTVSASSVIAYSAGVPELITREYDSGGIGDSFLTRTYNYYGLNPNTEFVMTNYHRTWRGHLRGTDRKNGADPISPYTARDVDWLGRTIATARYKTEPSWSSFTKDYDPHVVNAADKPAAPGHNDVVVTKYDDLGRVYRTLTYPGTEGTKHLVNNNYHDLNGRLVCSGQDYGVYTEYAYDGAGRQYQVRAVAAAPDTSGANGAYEPAGSFSYFAPTPDPNFEHMSDGNKRIIELTHSQLDASGNVTAEHTLEMCHNDYNNGDMTGSNTGIDLSGSDYIRRTVYHWYDKADRMVKSIDYGSGDTASGAGAWKHIGTVPPRPTTDPDTSNEEYLVTKYSYDTAGRQEIVIDPAGTKTKTFYDDLGRRTYVAENHDDFEGSPPAGIGGGTNHDADRVTGWQYNGLGLTTHLTAYNASSGANDQVTEYNYLDNHNASLVTKTIYPDGDSSNDNVTRSYGLDGSLVSMTDQRGVVHTYKYNERRQLKLDGVSIPSGVADDAIKSIGRDYDDLGRLVNVTSYSTSDGSGAPVNDILYEYDESINKLQYSYQSHQGQATTSSPETRYHYDTGFTNTSQGDVYDDALRLKIVTYPLVPSGTNWPARCIYGFNQTGSLNDRLSRPGYTTTNTGSWMSGDKAVTSSQVYNGTSRIVRLSCSHDGADLTEYRDYTTAGNYDRLDRFGRTLERQWTGPNGATIDHLHYTYDYAGNRKKRDIDSSLYTTNDRDQKYTYDGLHRLSQTNTGTLLNDDITNTAAKFRQLWTLDQLGNWSNYQRDGFFDYSVTADNNVSDPDDLNQTRLHNDANEIDTNNDHSDVSGDSITATVGYNWADPSYDAAGNMDLIPIPHSPSGTYTAKYDAWNRLVSLEGGAARQEHEYDGLNRRIVRRFGTIHTGSYVITNENHFYYNNRWQVIVESKVVTSVETPTCMYCYHPHYVDAPIAKIRPTVAYYYQHDANFNITSVISSFDQLLKERYDYTPYGEVTILDPDFSVDADQKSDILNEYLYTGRRLDPGTGDLSLPHASLQCSAWAVLESRYYWGTPGSHWSLYQYVESRPCHFTDPLGLAAFIPACGAAGACASASASQSNQSQQPAGAVGGPNVPPNFFDENNKCKIKIKLICRSMPSDWTGLFSHCFLLAVDESTGENLGAISGIRDDSPDSPTSGMTISAEDAGVPCWDIDEIENGQEYDEYPFKPSINHGNSFGWWQCAQRYGQQISGQFPYSQNSDNSNTFITRVTRHCGAYANFPFSAFGSDDIALPLPVVTTPRPT